jgi:hypothetical protein
VPEVVSFRFCGETETDKTFSGKEIYLGKKVMLKQYSEL